MEFLDWQTDGVGAILVLVLYGVILLAFVARGVGRIQSISRLLPAAIAWHFAMFLFIAFWLVPHYAALGQVDAVAYFDDGMRNAGFIRSGEWQNLSWQLGTDIVPLVTGMLFAPFGGDIYGVLFFSAVLGLCGSLYLCRSFSLWATPDQVRKYSLIILFLPSFTMWTSIFGKDSWICLGIGLAGYGYSLMLKGHAWTGLWHLLVGLAITTAIRPHISLALGVSMVLAYLWAVTQARRGSIIAKIGIVVSLGVMSAALFSVASGFLGLSDFSPDSMETYAAQRESANTGGGSNVEVVVAPGAMGAIRALPRGIVRVLFEPFPWEVNNFNAGLASAENLFLLWFTLVNARRLRRLARGMAREPYFLFSAAISLMVMLMLILTPNFGLISRQRAQLLPFLFAPLVAASSKRRRIVPIDAITADPVFTSNLRYAGYPASAPSLRSPGQESGRSNAPVHGN